MARTPTTNTPRLVVQYTSGGKPHTLTFRFPDSVDQATALSKVEGILDAMQPLMMPSDSIYGGFWYPDGSHVSVPTGIPTIVGTNAKTTATAEEKTHFISVVGRSPSGKRVTHTLFTPCINVGYFYRVGAAAIGAPWTAFHTQVTATENSIVAVDGFLPYWKSYFNCGSNAYFQRTSR